MAQHTLFPGMKTLGVVSAIVFSMDSPHLRHSQTTSPTRNPERPSSSPGTLPAQTA